MTVGSKKEPPLAWRLPPARIVAPPVTASATCSSTFRPRPVSISGPRTDAAVLEAGTDFQLRDLRRQLVDEFVMDARLYQKAIGADAGLAGVAVF